MSHYKKPSFGVLTGTVCLFFSASACADLSLSAPPRETKADGEAVYGPLADYLSRVIGEKVTYKYPANWGLYQALMTRGEYDLVLDGPHFVAWRIKYLGHAPVVALDGKLNYVVVARKDNAHVHNINDLVGKHVCAHAPPNLATLTMLERFPNEARQPHIVEVKGFKAAYDGVVSNQCAGTVVPVEMYKKFDGSSRLMNVLYESRPMSNQALSAGTRVSEEQQKRIAQAMLAPEGMAVTHAVAEGLGATGFVAARKEDYRDYDSLLQNAWGFAPPTAK